MAKVVAHGDSGLPYRSHSEHHYSDKTTKEEDVKEQCPDGGSQGMSTEPEPELCYAGRI